tara:strand:+ start:7776 stop:10358 length:2583 start_codon:yes stop_codon:yes gene_type:complete
VFLYLSKIIIRNSITLLTVIGLLTGYFFYQAFYSENQLKIDFSIEHMFPNKDDEKDYYDQFKTKYGREDNTIFLSFSNDDIFSNQSLTIIEYLSENFKNIKNIDFVYSLGNLWNDGDGKIGNDLTKNQRKLKVQNNKIYSNLLSKDGNSSIILLKINEQVDSHEERKAIFDQLDSIKKTLNYSIVYDGVKFYNDDLDLKHFYNKIPKNNNDLIYIIKNDNVLSESSVGPYSILNEFTNSFDNTEFENKITSINNCYDLINSNDYDFDKDLNLTIIKEECYDYKNLINDNLSLSAIKVSNNDNHIKNTLKLRESLFNNSYVKFKSWKWHEAGLPVLRTRYIELVEYERSLFLPIVFIIAAITLLWVFRQIKALLIALISILISLVWISGLMSLMNISINVISYLTFNLLMIIGVSDAIHLLMKYHEEVYKNENKNKALSNVIIEIGSALFLTSFTTAVGFLSLSITNIRILQEFGIIMGIGIAILFLITIIVMPIILSYIDKPSKKHIKRLMIKKKSSLTHSLLSLVNKYPKPIIYVSIITFIISLHGLSKMNSNITVMGDLKPGNKLYEDLNFVETQFGGTLPLEIVIPYTELQPITHNRLFQKQYLKFINQVYEIDAIKSITGYWDMYGNPNFQQQNYINDKRDELRISCGIKSINSEEADLLKEKITNTYKNIFNNDNLNITGSTLLTLKMNGYLLTSLLNSFIIAFIIIFISMIILFKSFKLSLVSIIPNIFPLLFAGGVMGYTAITLRPATAMTFSIALGIAVDDTIHFLSRFRYEFKKTNSHVKSTSKTILTTGRAIISTTMTLAMGFVVLIFSNFKPNSQFGVLSTIILIIALLASLLLLPSLINVMKPLKDKE